MSEREERPLDAPASEVPKRKGVMRKVLGGAVVIVLVVAGAVGALFMSMSSGTSLNVGDKAPDFTLPDQTGRMVTLSSVLAEHKGAVVAFYPADFTPG